MLVIVRKPGERIIIGDRIVVTLLNLSGGRARIGIEAPRDLPIHRMEVREQAELEEAERQRA